MIAKIFGKSDIYEFKIEIFGDIKSFDFLKVTHQESGEVLTQVINVIRDADKLIGECKVIGFRDAGVLKNIRTPFSNDANIEIATDKFIEETVGLNTDEQSFFGVLEHHPDLRISLDLKKAITRHIAVLAKSGAGKSYTVGVLLEEILRRKVPVLILDPHNEYSSLKYPNSDKKDLKRLEKFGLKPQGFLGAIKEYSPDTTINPQCEHISLDLNKLKPNDLMELLPQKLSPGQQSLLYNTLSNLNNRINFDELIFTLSNEDSNSKWSIISLLEQLKKLKLYSTTPTPLTDIVKQGKCSIVSLKGVEPYVSEAFVSGLLKDLFEARKKEEIPPFFIVIEEAHNFCPERSFGELKTSKVIRTIAAEGRKFGIGLCVVSQRPAKIDKNVVSQCTTQILLKMTNPNDLKSVISSSEGVSSESENEIQKLNIGTCLLTGVIDIPLKVNVRPRVSKHGGETVDITLSYEVEESAEQRQVASVGAGVGVAGKTEAGEGKKEIREISSSSPSPQSSVSRPSVSQSSSLKSPVSSPQSPVSKEGEFVQYVAPEVSLSDAKVMLGGEVSSVLVPAFVVKLKSLKGQEVSVLFDRVQKSVVSKVFPYEVIEVSPKFFELSESEKKVLRVILGIGDKFNAAELLLKCDMMFNEILRVCDSLASKGIIKKVEKMFEIGGAKFGKEIEKSNFLGNMKFEELNYDSKLEPSFSESDVKALFGFFGEVLNVKEVWVLKFVKKG